MKFFAGRSPYLNGALVGIVLVLSVLISDKFLGASTSYVRSAGIAEQTINKVLVTDNNYFQKYADAEDKLLDIDWQWMLFVGVVLGAFVSSKLNKDFKVTSLPDMWKSEFGGSVSRRAIYSFIGGAIALFGVRLAGGCPSGHGISGLAQLSISGFVAMFFFFSIGIVTIKFLYKK